MPGTLIILPNLSHTVLVEHQLSLVDVAQLLFLPGILNAISNDFGRTHALTYTHTYTLN